MKHLRRVFIATLACLWAVTPSHAGLDLGWGDCAPDGGTISTVLDCTEEPSFVRLYGSFQLDNAVANHVSLEFTLDFLTSTSPSGDFWHFGPGECMDGNLVLLGAAFDSCPSTNTTPCKENGSECEETFLWATGFGGPNGHRLIGSVFRDPAQPVSLDAETNYFGFALEIFFYSSVEWGGGGTCVGCGDGGGVVWGSALASGIDPNGGEIQEEPLEGPGLVGNCVTFNGGMGPCAETATQNRTWGQIKSLYR